MALEITRSIFRYPLETSPPPCHNNFCCVLRHQAYKAIQTGQDQAMSTLKVQIRGWKRVVLIVLITIGAIWGGLKWAEKAYAKFQFKMRDTCWGYEFHSYLAFSPLDRIFPLRDRPVFLRVIEKKLAAYTRKLGFIG